MKLNDLIKKITAGSRGKKKDRKKLVLILVLVLAAAAAAFLICRSRKADKKDSETDSGSIGTVMRGSIKNELTSSGTLSPKDTYTITSLVSGEIISADFEEGDEVKEDQVLFTIDASDITKDVDSAARNLDSAKTAYDEAVTAHDKAIAELGGGTVCSEQTGYVQNITLKKGDTVGGSQSATVGDLYNDSGMTVKLGFLNTDADALSVGQDIVVELSDTGETIPGRVKAKSDLIQTVNSGTMIKYVTILVTNPGGLTTSDHATAYINDIISVTDGTFEPIESSSLKAELPSSVKVKDVLVTEGQYVTKGTALFTITDDSLADALSSAEDALTKAQNSLTDAQNKVTSMDDTVGKYTITAPISGQVIKKYMKAGDKIQNSSNSSNQMALIYDLSELTFEMSIDELDISSVKTGQEVVVTADAFEDRTYTGHVTNVGLNGTTSNGVTTYPVVVTLDDMEGLLPGMNVDGVIILEEAEDTLYIPANALQRGNIVYVKNDSLTDANTVSGSEADAHQPPEDGSKPDMSQMPEGGSKPDMSQMPEGGSKPDASESAGGESKDGSGRSSSENGKISSESGKSSSGNSRNSSGNSKGSSGSSSKSSRESSVSSSGVPEGYTAVQVETGIISNDYVEILSGLSEGQQVYVKDAVSDSTFGGFGGPEGMGMGGGQGGGPGGGSPGGGQGGSHGGF